jgi:hypothetical protein
MGSFPCGAQNQWLFCVWPNFNLIKFVKLTPPFEINQLFDNNKTKLPYGYGTVLKMVSNNSILCNLTPKGLNIHGVAKLDLGSVI